MQDGRKRKFLHKKSTQKKLAKKNPFTGFFRVLNFVKLCRTALNNVSFSDILKKIHGKIHAFSWKIGVEFSIYETECVICPKYTTAFVQSGGYGFPPIPSHKYG